MLSARLRAGLRPVAPPHGLRLARALCARPAAPPLVSTQQHGDVCVVRLDDGEMNAFSFQMLEEVHRALDDAQTAGAVVLTGNSRCFSAGVDLKVMGSAPSADAARLLQEGGELLFRLLQFPRPLVMAVPGHSMALGAIVLLAGDLRIGCDDLAKCKVGLNEVHIGMPNASFRHGDCEVAHVASAPHARRTLGQLYKPSEAVEVGYLDMLVPHLDLETRVIEMAQQLSLLGKPFHTTKMFDRGALLEKCQE
eukprot:7381778-Prymnesium_polylepis.2